MSEAAAKKIADDSLTEVIIVQKGITDEEILDLKLKGFSHQRIADILGCSKTNITQRLGKFKDELEGLEGFKKNRADIFALHQIRALKAVTDEKLKKANVRDLTILAGTLYDKEQQERGLGGNKNTISIILQLAHDAREVGIIDIN